MSNGHRHRASSLIHLSAVALAGKKADRMRISNFSAIFRAASRPAHHQRFSFPLSMHQIRVFAINVAFFAIDFWECK